MSNKDEPAGAGLELDQGNAWQVVCLCAQWCGVCREFRSIFEALERSHPGLHMAWVDVEDEEEVVGDLDVETFPTVLVAGGGRARFFGPVLPQPGVLARLLASLQADPDGPGADASAQALLQRVLARR